MKLVIRALLALVLAGLLAAPAIPDSTTRSLDIETTEVTRPDVAVSPDGKWLIFTALGHLFRLSTAGGTAGP